MIWRGNIIDIGMDQFFALSNSQRDELIAWIDEQVGHHVRGVTRTELRRRGKTLRISGIVKVQTKPGVWCSAIDPLQPKHLARYTGDFPVRTAPPAWWQPRHAWRTSRAH